MSGFGFTAGLLLSLYLIVQFIHTNVMVIEHNNNTYIVHVKEVNK